MIKLRLDQVAAATAGTLYNTDMADRVVHGVAIDSRTVKTGQLFVAIQGERNDGHDYLTSAIDRGARAVLVADKFPGLHRLPGNIGTVAVSDTHQAMIQLAMSYRESLNCGFIGITGSSGKTTTKEMTYSLLRAITDHAYCSPGNLNNLYGVPLAICGIPADTEAAVLELGISTDTEMPRLAAMVQPDVALITNVGPSHLEFFGTIENVAGAKLELARRAPAAARIIVNADDPILIAQANDLDRPLVTFGNDNKADFYPDAVEVSSEGSISMVIRGQRFNLGMAGRHQQYNLLAAYAATSCLGLSFDGVDTSAIKFSTASMRGETLELGGITFVVDCYNANPDSVTAGLEQFFARSWSGRRIVVLGDMLELGTSAVAYHEAAGAILSQYDWEMAILVGTLSRHTSQALVKAVGSSRQVNHFPDATKAARYLGGLCQAGDLVYLKASRGIGLEVALEQFQQQEENH